MCIKMGHNIINIGINKLPLSHIIDIFKCQLDELKRVD